jgi:hypothetical protein
MCSENGADSQEKLTLTWPSAVTAAKKPPPRENPTIFCVGPVKTMQKQNSTFCSIRRILASLLV